MKGVVEAAVTDARELSEAELAGVSGGLSDASKNEVAIEGLVSVPWRQYAL